MPYVAKIRLLSYARPVRKIFLSRELAEAANLPAKSFLTVSVGFWKARLQVGIHKRSSHLVFVPRDVYSAAGKFSKTLHISISNEEISLGPWIGVYAFQNIEKPPFGPLNPMLRDMFKIASSMGLPLYILCPGEMTKSAGKSTVSGFEYTGGNWIESEFPFPTFLISKIVITPPKFRTQVIEEIERLKERGCKFLSQTIGDKWKIYREMDNLDELRKYLPQTVLLQDANRVSEFLDRYGGVYIKPAKGTQGISVYRLRLDGKKNWKLSFRKDEKVVSVRIPFAIQKNWVKKQTQRVGGFLLQQEIQLLQDNQNRVTDFRWLLQKNKDGNWEITSRIARTGTRGSTTTNLSTGGQVAQASECLQQWCNSNKINDLVSEIDQVCILCVEHLENSFGLMGELGIDIAIDNQFQIWILEANPRPGRKMLKKVSEAERLLSLTRPLEYARYATGFPL